jgi:hypothetical protein
MKTARVLPFRFVLAARLCTAVGNTAGGGHVFVRRRSAQVEGEDCAASRRFRQHGVPLLRKAEMTKADGGYGPAVLVRELCETLELEIDSFSDRTVRIPAGRGFALRDAIHGPSRTAARHHAGRCCRSGGGNLRSPHCHYRRAGA